MVLERLPFENIFFHIQGLNYGEGVYELEDHVGQGALSLNLLPRLGFVKRILHAHFSNRLLRNV
jgi:hypothetical protein